MSFINQFQMVKIKKIKAILVVSMFFYGFMMPILISIFLILTFFSNKANVINEHIIAAILIYLISIIFIVTMPIITSFKKWRFYWKDKSYREFSQLVFSFNKLKPFEQLNFPLTHFKFWLQFISKILVTKIFFLIVFAIYFLGHLLITNLSPYAISFLVFYFVILFFWILGVSFSIWKLSQKVIADVQKQ